MKSELLGGGKHFRILKNDEDFKVQFIVEGVTNAVATMPLNRFVQFRQYADEASARAMDVKRGKKNINYKVHLGGNMYLQVNSPYQGVSIRQFKNIGDANAVNIIPDKSGIFLLIPEWNNFIKLNEELDTDIPELISTTTCSDQTDHCNQEGYYTCLECCPNGENRDWF